jgi:hypothetical protein
VDPNTNHEADMQMLIAWTRREIFEDQQAEQYKQAMLSLESQRKAQAQTQFERQVEMNTKLGGLRDEVEAKQKAKVWELLFTSVGSHSES